ncbi:hypothetical protein J6590_087169, partial [Homalodisca vitripennis]
LNKEQFDEVLDLIDQGALSACAAIVASPTSAKNRSSRISQQSAADATNVAPRRVCQCDYLTT